MPQYLLFRAEEPSGDTELFSYDLDSGTLTKIDINGTDSSFPGGSSNANNRSDAVVLGVSSDDAASHRSFAKKHELPFPLLSDPSGEVRKKFGVPNTLGVLPGRVTFVIDKGGIVRHVTNSQLSAKKHVDEALAALARLST